MWRKKLDTGQDSGRTLWTPPPRPAGDSAFEVAAIDQTGQQSGAPGGQQLAAKFHLAGTMAVGQKAVIADALKTRGQSVLQEAADELVGGHGHHPIFCAITIILPAEGDLAVFHSQQALVGNGHAMGIAGEVLDDVLRSAEGSLGVDDPFTAA
jgi:hypothetical protein